MMRIVGVYQRIVYVLSSTISSDLGVQYVYQPVYNFPYTSIRVRLKAPSGRNKSYLIKYEALKSEIPIN